MKPGTPSRQFLIIGDTEIKHANYGDVDYDEILFWGHSSAQFHDNFDDGSEIEMDIHGSASCHVNSL